MEFTVRVARGDVFINNRFVAQLCWDNDAITMAIASWLNNGYPTDDGVE